MMSKVTFFAHMVVFRRTQYGFTSTMEVAVTSDDPVEIRRIHIQNNNETGGTLRLTSNGEVILAPQSADTRHPAFNKLFIESEFYQNSICKSSPAVHDRLKKHLFSWDICLWLKEIKR